MSVVLDSSVVVPQALVLEKALSRQIRLAWQAHVHSGAPVSAAQHAVYALLRGQSLEKGFTPRTHPGRVQAVGGDPLFHRRVAEASARALEVSAWAPFASLLEAVPRTRPWAYDRTEHPLFLRVGKS